MLIGIILSVAVGFLYGTGKLGGSSADPGSKENPLLTTGYADSAINQRVKDMDDRINSLEAKVRSLENEISILTGEPLGSGDSDPAPSGSGEPAPPPAGSGNGGSGGSASQTNIGKTASVKADVVNLRESASTSSNIKKKLTPSDTFTITKVDKDWYQVQLSDGTVGWVAGYLVNIK